MPFLAVADDLTGAQDLGGRLAGRRGGKAWVARRTEDLRGAAGSLVLDVETRFVGPAVARRAVSAAWAALPGGALLRFQKIDSTLRGNPAAEIEGLLQATAAPWVAVLPAYPAMGRTTRQGRMFVNGKRLEQSEYAHDPLTPARIFRPADLFDARLTVHAPLAAVSAGPARLQAWLKARLAKGARFVTFDCETETQVACIAQACLGAGGRHFAGASGLAGALADIVDGPARRAALPKGMDWLVLAGTVSASSFSQLEVLQASGAAHWEPRLRRKGSGWAVADGRSVSALRRRMMNDHGLALSSLACREDLAPWCASEAKAGRNGPEAAQRAVDSLVAWGLQIAGPWEHRGFFVTGGHTLAAFYGQAGLRRFAVHGEALPGVPLGRADGPGGACWLASKPGGFGTQDLYPRFLGH